ncbi:MAG: hypothetical protein H6709_19600 [Kofleriaceae bacterium]|nr:hypothetical protein [Kofleriaceae bacterium]
MTRSPVAIAWLLALTAVSACGGDDAAAPDAAAADAAGPDAEACGDAGCPGVCAQELPCPAAGAGAVNVCGRLVDAEADELVQAALATTDACGAGGVDDGPCRLAISFHDAVTYAADPAASAPLAVDELTRDDCGRFRALGVAAPPGGFLAIVVDDVAGGDDLVAPTVVATPAPATATLLTQRPYALRREIDAAWSSAAGLTGDGFAARGAILGLFDRFGAPVAGVAITDDGAPRPADTYGFTDAAAAPRATPSATAELTGAGGAVLLVGSAWSEHGGSGVEPTDCAWSTAFAAAIPGALFVQRFTLLDPDGDRCP